MPSSWAHDPRFFAVAAVVHAAIALLWAAQVAPFVRSPRDRAIAVATGVVALAWTAWWLGPAGAWLPTAWLTPLQEGFGESALQALAGGNLHGGATWEGFWLRLRPGGAPTMAEVVTVSAWLTGLDVLLLAHVVLRLARDRVLGALLVVAWATCPLTLSTAMSMQPGAAVGLYLLVGAVAVTGRWGLPGGLRLLQLALVTLAAASMRVELAGLGGAALVAVAWSERFPTRAAALGLRWRTAWARWDDAPRTVRAAVVAGLLAWWCAAPFLNDLTPVRLPWPGSWRWFGAAINPANDAWLTLPIFLLATVSAGAVALVVRGLWRALRHGPGTALLAVTSLLLFQAYYAAAHGQVFRPGGEVAVLEVWRYLPLLLPVWVVLAAWAIPATRGAVRALWVVALLAPVLPEATHVLPRFRAHRDARTAEPPRLGLLDADLVRQARFVAAALRDAPDCAVVSRVRVWSSSPEAPEVVDAVLYPARRDGHLRTTRLPPAPDGRLALDALPPDVPGGCVLLLRSVDCDLAGGQVDCAPILPTTAPWRETTFATRPLTFADHTGGWAGTTQTIALYRLVPPG
ncbi:MAG: hypothetical protein H6733_04755 [Alphaproteobacteria bacterium]|nr:hypothetical protein [Alphaproteobacteria bacterium]